MLDITGKRAETDNTNKSGRFVDGMEGLAEGRRGGERASIFWGPEGRRGRGWWENQRGGGVGMGDRGRSDALIGFSHGEGIL